jgi:hypothetical protein
MREHLKRRLAAATVAVVVALVGAGTAIACDGKRGEHQVLGAKYALGHGLHRHGLLALPSAYLGVSRDAIKTQLAAGKTLAQIANATPGKSAAGLVDYVVAAAKTKLDARVAAGKLTQAKEDELLAKLRTKLTALVDSVLTKHDRSAWHHR